MKRFLKKHAMAEGDRITEAYEVRAFRDEEETASKIEERIPDVPHADANVFQAIKAMPKGHGEQTVLPDDCQFGDNEQCNADL